MNTSICELRKYREDTEHSVGLSVAARIYVGLLGKGRRWYQNWRTRRNLAELAELNDYLLKDIGVSRGEAMEEARKPFWRD